VNIYDEKFGKRYHNMCCYIDDHEYSDISYAQDPAKKLGRGLANILTGWVELPKNIYDTSVEDNPLSGLTIGLAKGVG